MRRKGSICVAMALALGGCQPARKGADSQVLAVVDGSEVTAPMLSGALAGLGTDAGAKDPAIQKQALQQLVSEVLLARKAEDMKLDKSPTVDRALDSARRRVLAEAYLDKVAAERTPSDLEVVNFFGQHAYLFGNRHRYDLTIVQVQGRPEDARPYLTAFKKPGMTVDLIARQLIGNGVAVVANHRTLGADELPDPVARNLVTASPGDLLTFRQGDIQHFVQVVSIAPDPVSLQTARPMITRFLAAQRRARLGAEQLRQLRAGGTIEYQPLGRRILDAGGSAAPSGTT